MGDYILLKYFRVPTSWFPFLQDESNADVTKYIGKIDDVAVKIYPVTASGNGGNGCPSPASISIDDGNLQKSAVTIARSNTDLVPE